MERLTEKWNGKYLADVYDYENDDGGLGHAIPLDNVKVELLIQKLGEYEDLEEQGLLLKLLCKIGDTVYVDSKTIPTENMDFEEVKDIPLYFKAIVVSFRKNSNGTYIKLKVKAKWLHEWIDPECGPDSSYYEIDKYFTYPLSAIGKTVFLTQAEAEEARRQLWKI